MKRGDETPCISHPLVVACILAYSDYSAHIVAVEILHDVIYPGSARDSFITYLPTNIDGVELR